MVYGRVKIKGMLIFDNKCRQSYIKPTHCLAFFAFCRNFAQQNHKTLTYERMV